MKTFIGIDNSFDIVHLPKSIAEATVEFIPLNELIFTLPNGEQYSLTNVEQMARIGFDTTTPEYFNNYLNSLISFFGQGGPIEIPNTYDLPDGLASVSFVENFLVTPLVFMLANEVGSDAAYIRYKNVTKSGFDAVIVEPSNYDGAHAGQIVSYFAFLPGKYNLGSITIEVVYIDTIKVQGDYAPAENTIGWDRVTLSQNYTNLSVITSIQTMNNEENAVPTTISTPWMTPTVKIVDDRSFDITLDMSETEGGVVSIPERIAYVAFSSNQQTTFTDANGKSIKAETIKPTNIVGWDDGGTNVTLNNSYDVKPLMIASLNSRTSTEGGWLRIDDSASSATSLNLKIDHDSTQNTERNHTAETAGMLVISEPFTLKNN